MKYNIAITFPFVSTPVSQVATDLDIAELLRLVLSIVCEEAEVRLCVNRYTLSSTSTVLATSTLVLTRRLALPLPYSPLGHCQRHYNILRQRSHSLTRAYLLFQALTHSLAHL